MCQKGVDPNRTGTPPNFGIGESIAETIGWDGPRVIPTAVPTVVRGKGVACAMKTTKRGQQDRLSIGPHRVVRTHDGVVKSLTCTIDHDRVTIALHVQRDAELELWTANRQRELFEREYKMPLHLELADVPAESALARE